MKVELFYDKYVLSTVILNADCFSREERIADQSDGANDENNELDDEEASDWGRSDENLLDNKTTNDGDEDGSDDETIMLVLMRMMTVIMRIMAMRGQNIKQ